MTGVEYEAQFEKPLGPGGVGTMITVMHPDFGVKVFYLHADDWHDNIRGLLTPYWVNGFTMTLVNISS
jgi:hypothetical protein